MFTKIGGIFFRMKFEIRKKRLYIAILAVFFVFYLLLNYSFLKMNLVGFWADEVYHLRHAYDFHHNLTREGLFGFFFHPPTFYPPFTYQVTTFFFMIFGVTLESAIFSQAVFQLILMLSAFYLGLTVFDEDTGLLAALSVMTNPFLLNFTHRYYLDIPAAAMTALCLLCLVKCRYFKNAFWTYCFFISAALGMLTRMQFVLYMAIPFLWVFFVFLKEAFQEKSREEKITLAFRLAAVPAAFLAAFFILQFSLRTLNLVQPTLNAPGGSVWFPPRGYESADSPAYKWRFLLCFLLSLVPLGILFFLAGRWKKDDGSISGFVRGSVFFPALVWFFYGTYPNKIWLATLPWRLGGGKAGGPLELMKLSLQSQGYFLAIMALIGIAYYFFLCNKDFRTGERSMITAGYIGGMVIFMLFPLHDVRYFLPLSVFAALTGVSWMPRVKIKPLRWVTFTIAIYFCLLGWLGWFLYGTPWLAHLDIISRKIDGYQFNSLFRERPMLKGLATADLVDTAEKLGENGKYMVLWISPREKYGDYTIMNTMLRYRFGKMYRYTDSPEEIDRPDMGKLRGLMERVKGLNPGRLECLVLYDPAEGHNPEKYDSVILIYTLPAGQAGEIMKKKSEASGWDISLPKIDISFILGPGPGMDKEGIISGVERIRLKERK